MGLFAMDIYKAVEAGLHLHGDFNEGLKKQGVFQQGPFLLEKIQDVL